MRTPIAIVLLLAFGTVSGPAFASCPPTHYECGESSCCPL